MTGFCKCDICGGVYHKDDNKNYDGLMVWYADNDGDIMHGNRKYDIVAPNGETLKGWFYAQDLSIVHTNGDPEAEQATWAIERIVERRKQGGREELFVKWKGFDERYNSWIPASTLIINK